MKNLAAFTETHNSQPGYVNFSETDDGTAVQVTVRTRTSPQLSAVTMTREDAIELAEALLAKLRPVTFPVVHDVDPPAKAAKK